MEPAIILAAALLAFAIGSNDSSNSFGICVGCGVVSFRTSTYILAAMVLLGFVLASQRVIATVGSELAELNAKVVATSMVISAAAIIIANLLRTPVSSHQAIVASLVGSSLALGLEVSWDMFAKIVVSWIVSPLGAMLLGIVLYAMIRRLTARRHVLSVERILRVLLITSGCVVAFNTGANELATAMAAAVGYGALDFYQAALLGVASLYAGSRMVNKRVAETVGKGITVLDVFSGLSAQLAAGLTVLFFTFLGMPVSTTYCVVGAIAGVGAAKSTRSVRFSLLRRVFVSWMATPTLAFAASFLLLRAF
ncbi:MAG: inorganic phosphate transporter [Archaeoglobaceae archaeon]